MNTNTRRSFGNKIQEAFINKFHSLESELETSIEKFKESIIKNNKLLSEVRSSDEFFIYLSNLLESNRFEETKYEIKAMKEFIYNRIESTNLEIEQNEAILNFEEPVEKSYCSSITNSRIYSGISSPHEPSKSLQSNTQLPYIYEKSSD